MSASVELEIKSLLDQLGDPQAVTPRLIEFLEMNLEEEPLTLEKTQSLARFLLRSHQYTELVNYILLHLEEENFPIPWAYFLEALVQLLNPLSDEIAEQLIEGIKERHAEKEACLSSALDSFNKEFKIIRSDRKHKAAKDYQRLKQQMLDELYTLRTQQLFEQEKVVLAKLQKMDPDDPTIKKELDQQKERFAIEVLTKYKPKLTNKHFVDEIQSDPDLQKWSSAMANAFLEATSSHPEIAYDFAIACFMLDEHEACLAILDQSPSSAGKDWLRLEVLLRCRRFAELLSEVSRIEVQYAHEPETFFATAYLRAQALWGLGQKHNAIDVLESLLESRPHYRAGLIILNNWRSL